MKNKNYKILFLKVIFFVLINASFTQQVHAQTAQNKLENTKNYLPAPVPDRNIQYNFSSGEQNINARPKFQNNLTNFSGDGYSSNSASIDRIQTNKFKGASILLGIPINPVPNISIPTNKP